MIKLDDSHNGSNGDNRSEESGNSTDNKSIIQIDIVSVFIFYLFIGGFPRHCDRWSLVLPMLSSSWHAATAPPSIRNPLEF